MNKSLEIIPIVSLLLLLAGCSTGIQTASFVPQEAIEIDANGNEWLTHLQYDKKGQMGYAVANNNEFLYLYFQLADRTQMRKAIMFGSTIWIDPQGGKKKTFGIAYPLSAGREYRQSMRPDPQGGRRGRMPLNDILATQWEMEIRYPKEDFVRRLPLDNPGGISLQLNPSRSGLIYELRLPLTAPSTDNPLLKLTTGQTIGIGFETGEMQMGQMGGRTGGSRPGMSGQMPMGSRSGGMGRAPGNRPEMSEMTEPFRLWINTELVVSE